MNIAKVVPKKGRFRCAISMAWQAPNKKNREISNLILYIPHCVFGPSYIEKEHMRKEVYLMKQVKLSVHQGSING